MFHFLCWASLRESIVCSFVFSFFFFISHFFVSRISFVNIFFRGRPKFRSTRFHSLSYAATSEREQTCRILCLLSEVAERVTKRRRKVQEILARCQQVHGREWKLAAEGIRFGRRKNQVSLSSAFSPTPSLPLPPLPSPRSPLPLSPPFLLFDNLRYAPMYFGLRKRPNEKRKKYPPLFCLF